MTPSQHAGAGHRVVWRWAGITLAGLALLLAGGDRAQDNTPPKPPAPDFAGRPTYEVVGVSAGNIISVRQDGAETVVHLIGTYVPRGGGGNGEAQTFLTRLLAGETVYLIAEPDWPAVDEGGRRWAYVYRAPDGLLVNLELVRQGYVRVASGRSFEHESLWRAYERVARRNEKGLWSRGTAEAAEPERAAGSAGPATSQPAGVGDDVLVYVTKSGKKYHRADCSHVRAGAAAIPLREAKAKGYTPCSRCKPPE